MKYQNDTRRAAARKVMEPEVMALNSAPKLPPDQNFARQDAKKAASGDRYFARGGKVKGDAKQDRTMVAKGVHQHEAALHKGQPKTTLKLAAGGAAKVRHGVATPAGAPKNAVPRSKAGR